MEIERKFLVKKIPSSILEDKAYMPPSKLVKEIKQAYISIHPVIRIRQANNDFYLTIKSHGNIAREEYEMRITEKEFHSLLTKSEGSIIEKTRYFIPLEKGLVAELDIFHGDLTSLTTVEVEFSSMDNAHRFTPPDWFGEDISLDPRYKNNHLSLNGLPD